MSYLQSIRDTIESQASTKVIADTGDFLDSCNAYLNAMNDWRIAEPTVQSEVTLGQAYHAAARSAVRQVMEALVQNTVMYAANAVNKEQEAKRLKPASLMVVRGNGHERH